MIDRIIIYLINLFHFDLNWITSFKPRLNVLENNFSNVPHWFINIPLILGRMRALLKRRRNPFQQTTFSEKCGCCLNIQKVRSTRESSPSSQYLSFCFPLWSFVWKRFPSLNIIRYGLNVNYAIRPLSLHFA